MTIHYSQSKNHSEILDKFRHDLYAEGILHKGDTIGEDDETLLYVFTFFHLCLLSIFFSQIPKLIYKQRLLTIAIHQCANRRFLRARKFDLAHAKKMFMDCQVWRKTVSGVGIDELYKRTDPFDYPEREAVFECWPMWFHKTDKQGRPLNVHVFGGMDLNKLYKTCSPERHWETFLVNAESLTREVLPAAARAAGKPIGTTFVIVDLKGFGLGAFWQMKSLVRASFQVSQDYYPETMGQLAIINAPSSFTIIWNAIKPWLSKETLAKVDVLGSDYQDVLLELVEEESLPSVLGGKCECKAEGGCHLSGAGPWLEGRVGWGPKKVGLGKVEVVDEKETAQHLEPAVTDDP